MIFKASLIFESKVGAYQSGVLYAGVLLVTSKGMYYKSYEIRNERKMDRLCCKFGRVSKLMTKALAYY
jgi:hypothetical protein